MRRNAWVVMAALCALIIAGLTAATASAGGEVIYGGQDQTICHATASPSGGNQHNGYDLITVSVDSIVKDNGHGSHTDIGGRSDIIPAFEYTKTVKGHGQDPDVTTTEHYPGLGGGDISDCQGGEEPPTDVCPNLQGVQETVPDGYIVDENGDCVPAPPVDVCPNLEGNQTEVPEGYELVNGECVPVTPPVDVCPNIDGNQATVPAGMVKDEQGNCVTPPTPPRCPPGMTPTAGKDGEPGNDECEFPPSTPPSTPPTSTVPPATTPPATPPAVTPPTTVPPSKPKAAPKAKPKPKQRTTAVKARKKVTVPKPDRPHVCLPLKDGTKRAWWKGGNGVPAGCYAVIAGSG